MCLLLCSTGLQLLTAQELFSNGASCGCPEVSLRDTIWVSDNLGAGVGTNTWSCEHVYVLTEQVFVNSLDTLTIEPGTVIKSIHRNNSHFHLVSNCKKLPLLDMK